MSSIPSTHTGLQPSLTIDPGDIQLKINKYLKIKKGNKKLQINNLTLYTEELGKQHNHKLFRQKKRNDMDLSRNETNRGDNQTLVPEKHWQAWLQ